MTNNRHAAVLRRITTLTAKAASARRCGDKVRERDIRRTITRFQREAARLANRAAR